MNIQGLDYNTQREKLIMPEYGREVQNMIEHAVALKSKEERLRCAKTIVKLMESKVPQSRDNKDYQQMLWDHLYLMSHKSLDIDWPYDVSGAERFYAKPEPLPLPQSNIRMRHYGKLLGEVLEKLKNMPKGSERDELARLTAYQMKRSLMAWGHGSAEDAKVADDMARLTDGVIQLDPNNMHLESVTMPEEQKRTGKKRR